MITLSFISDGLPDAFNLLPPAFVCIPLIIWTLSISALLAMATAHLFVRYINIIVNDDYNRPPTVFARQDAAAIAACLHARYNSV